MKYHLPYGITQCYLPPDTSELALTNSSQTGWYSIYLSQRGSGGGRLSWPRWLVTYREPRWFTCQQTVSQSPILGVTRPDVEQPHWSRPTC